MTSHPSANQAKNNPAEVLLSIRGLRTVFDSEEGQVHAVGGVDLDIHHGETLGLVGESGCGKSVTSLSILRLVSRPGRIVSGTILYKGEDLLSASKKRIRQIRGNEISMIFQEPMTSLNPVLKVGDQIAEVVRLHRGLSGNVALEETVQILKSVGISEPAQRIHDYPHQLSGGMRQRVMIAMALVCRPSLLIADEPSSALDVTIQAQILDLLRQIQSEFDLSILLISHDLGVIAEMADRVAVMYAGQIVEEAPVEKLYRHTYHPYTRGLLRSLPATRRVDKPRERGDDGAGRARLETIKGTVPDLLTLPEGCSFADRCPDLFEPCRACRPEESRPAPDHRVYCHLYASKAVGPGGTVT